MAKRRHYTRIKIPATHLTCDLCGESKPAHKDYFYWTETKLCKEACKQCVESRIQEQAEVIKKQVEAGTRLKVLTKDRFPPDQGL